MFKLKDFSSEAVKQAAAIEVKMRLDELPAKINLIRRYEAGVDLRKLSWSYDIVLVMDFDNLCDLNAYTVHPAHQEFVAFNRDYSVAKAVVDFEIC